MRNKEWVAMILALGNHLGVLTQEVPKPVVPFGGQYRLIDFALSNCRNSGLDTVGILTQYRPLLLTRYVGNGNAWELDRSSGGVHILPPFFTEQGGEWYKGTADAIYQNLEFIDKFEPDYVLVLSGDHIYKMDYAAMLKQHKSNQADVTLGVVEVPWEDVSWFNIVEMGVDKKVTAFAEKPRQPKNNQASMGVYIFSRKVLEQYLANDAANSVSTHDLSKDIIPALLAAGKRIYGYPFGGYWTDVKTVEKYWKASMDLLGTMPNLVLDDPDWPIFSPQVSLPPHYHGPNAKVSNSVIAGGAIILGEVENSIVFPGAYIAPESKVKDSVIMHYARIERGIQLDGVIVKANANIIPGMPVTAASGIIQVACKRQSLPADVLVKIDLAV